MYTLKKKDFYLPECVAYNKDLPFSLDSKYLLSFLISFAENPASIVSVADLIDALGKKKLCTLQKKYRVFSKQINNQFCELEIFRNGEIFLSVEDINGGNDDEDVKDLFLYILATAPNQPSSIIELAQLIHHLGETDICEIYAHLHSSCWLWSRNR